MDEIKPIIGNATPTPPPRPDWNQEDEKKGDYIKNKPLKEIQAINSLKYYGDANIVPSGASLFAFTCFDQFDEKVASVKASSNSIVGDIVIPYEIVENGKVFSVTSIQVYAFSDCVNITSVIIPDSVTILKEGAFGCCYALKSVTIPKSVTSIESGVFHEDRNLVEVYYEGTKEQWNAIEIGEDNEYLLNATIHYECVPTTKSYVDEKIAEVVISGDGTVVDSELNVDSENPVQNKVVAMEIDGLTTRVQLLEQMVFSLDNDYASRLTAIEQKLGM